RWATNPPSVSKTRPIAAATPSGTHNGANRIPSAPSTSSRPMMRNARIEYPRHKNRQRYCGDPHDSAPTRHRVGQNTDAFDFDLDDIAGNEELIGEEASACRCASANDVAG